MGIKAASRRPFIRSPRSAWLDQNHTETLLYQDYFWQGSMRGSQRLMKTSNMGLPPFETISLKTSGHLFQLWLRRAPARLRCHWAWAVTELTLATLAQMVLKKEPSSIFHFWEKEQMAFLRKSTYLQFLLTLANGTNRQCLANHHPLLPGVFQWEDEMSALTEKYFPLVNIYGGSTIKSARRT